MSMSFPVTISVGPDGYTGTVVTGLPVPSGFIFEVSDKLIACSVDGPVALYPTSAAIITRNSDGSARWLLTAITGTFPPGETHLFLGYDAQASADTLIPPHHNILASTVFTVTTVDAAGAMTTFDLPFSALTPATAIAHYSTKNYSLLEWRKTITPTMRFVVFLEVRKGEPGSRVEFLIENTAPGFHDNGKPLIVRSAKISVNTPVRPPSADISLPFGSLPVPTNLGPLAIAYGSQRAPLKMYWESGRTVAEWITPDSRYPQGGRYAPETYPGELRSSDPQLHATSDLGLFVWEKLSVKMMVGAVGNFPQSNLDTVPMLRWSDPERYTNHVIGGIEPVYPLTGSNGAFLINSTSRYERVHQAYVNPAACDAVDPLKTVNGRIIDSAGNEVPAEYVKITNAGPKELTTHRRFVERGGTYPKPRNKNSHFGAVHFGDHVWGDGKSGAAHYDVDHSCLWEFLRSGDLRWWKEASVMLDHLRTVDFAWSHLTDLARISKYDGLPHYEKGNNHGNFEVPNISHTWLGGAGLAFCLTGHPEYLQMMVQAASNVLIHKSLAGQPVPSDWQIGTAKDPRDYGAPSPHHRRGSTASNVNGWYGDWGVRIPARALELATALKVYAASRIYPWVADTIYQTTLSAVERVETQIWGRHGFILNRAFRSPHHFDTEQGWMHAYLVRGIGYALIYGDPKVTLPFRDLYDRMYSWLKHCVVYGAVTPTGVTPPRLAANFNEVGPTQMLRPGIRSVTESLWYPWRDDVTNRAKFDAWYASLIAEAVYLSNYVNEAGLTAWITQEVGYQMYLSAASRIKASWDAGAVPSASDADYKFLVGAQWDWLEQSSSPNVNHCAIASDALAQGALELGRSDGAVMALRLIEHTSWRLQDSTIKELPNIFSSPSDVAYRMAQYPSSETKIYGNQLETRYARRILSSLQSLGHAVWSPEVADIPQESELDPFK